MNTVTETRDWNDRFVLRLRGIGVPGPQIADALKTVETHCADTGESPQEAFGDPAEYAESLGFPPRLELGSALWALPAFLGTSVTINGLTDVLRGESTSITVWDLAMWGVVVAFGVLVAVALTRLRSPWLVLGVLVAVLTVISVVASRLGGPTLLEVNPWVVLAVGVALLIGTVLSLWRLSSADRVIDPVDGTDMAQRDERAYVRWVPAILMLLALAIVVLVALV